MDDSMAATLDVARGMVMAVDGIKIPKVMVEAEGEAEDIVSAHQ